MSVNEIKEIGAVLESANEYHREKALREKMDMPENVNTLNETEEQRNLTEREAPEKEVNALTETEEEEPRNMEAACTEWKHDSCQADDPYDQYNYQNWEKCEAKEFAGGEKDAGTKSLANCKAECENYYDPNSTNLEYCYGIDWNSSNNYCWLVNYTVAFTNAKVKDHPSGNYTAYRFQWSDKGC